MLYHVSINFVSFASRILESAVLGWCKDRHCNYVWHRSVPWKKLKTAAGPWARPHMWQSLSIFYNSRKYSGQAFSGNLLLGNTIAIIITVHVPGPHTWPRPGPSQAPRPNSKTQLQLPFWVGSVPTPIGRGEAKMIFSTLLQLISPVDRQSTPCQTTVTATSEKTKPWASQDNPGYAGIENIDWDNPGPARDKSG